MKPLRIIAFNIIFVILGVIFMNSFVSNPIKNKSELKNLKIESKKEALEELKLGNIRFIKDSLINNNYKKQIEISKTGQRPHSLILTCMDSRVPPEIIFDQGIGNIIVLRNAGNLEDENMLGSMEYAVKYTSIKQIVILGHSHCGAIKGAIDGKKHGNLTQLLDQIKPAIKSHIHNPNIYNETSINNVLITMEHILEKSSLIMENLNQKKIDLIGAFYEVETGEVEFME